MKSGDLLHRLRAFAAGEPLPVGDTLGVPRLPADDTLLLAFLRMGGESRPWGIAWMRPGGRPRVLTVPEPRNRDLVAAMVAEFAPGLLQHLSHPLVDPGLYESEHDLPYRQVWVAHSSHVDMLHHLGYAYSFTTRGDGDRPLLNAFGQACTWAFLESSRPGQRSVLNAGSVLTDSYAFPVDTAHLAHLGFVLALLGTPGGLGPRLQAAMDAERAPVSTSLEPGFEEEVLGPLVDAWNRARRSGDMAESERAAKAIDGHLGEELLRRLRLLEDALDRLAGDPRGPNPGVVKLVAASRENLWAGLVRPALRDTAGAGGRLSPETDRNPAAATARYLRHCAGDALLEDALLPHDQVLLEEAIASGDAVRAPLVSVQPDTAPGYNPTAMWTLREGAPVPLHLRKGDKVRLLSPEGLTGSIREIAHDATTRTITLRVEGKRRGLDPARFTVREPGAPGPRTVVLVGDPHLDLYKRKIELAWEDDGPGAWLTHAAPSGASRDPQPEPPGGDDGEPDRFDAATEEE